MSGQHPDQGFTLVEVLLVILVLGLLAAIVLFSVGGITADAESNSCAIDARTLETAVEAFFAQTDNRTIPSADGTPNGFERSLVERGFLRNTSRWFDLDPAGTLDVADGSPCTPPG